MKRGAFLFVLILGIVVLAACAPKPEEVNAVVNEFWTQWKAGNAAGMVDLLTDEVSYGLLLPDDLATSIATSLARLPANRSVPAATLVASLLSTPLPTLATFSISSTEAFGEYAIVTCLFTTTAVSATTMQFIFHLNDTDAGWKINFLGIKGLS